MPEYHLFIFCYIFVFSFQMDKMKQTFDMTNGFIARTFAARELACAKLSAAGGRIPFGMKFLSKTIGRPSGAKRSSVKNGRKTIRNHTFLCKKWLEDHPEYIMSLFKIHHKRSLFIS